MSTQSHHDPKALLNPLWGNSLLTSSRCFNKKYTMITISFRRSTLVFFLIFFGITGQVRVFYRSYVRFRDVGVSSTLEGRLHILAATAVHVLIYVLFWTLFAVPYFMTYQVSLR